MLSGDQDMVVPKKHMHTLWEIASKRGGTGKGGDEQPNGSSTTDVFKSFENGTHSEWSYGFFQRHGSDVLRSLT
jgi:hypothetical protein